MSQVDLVFYQVEADTKMPINETSYSVWKGCQLLGIEARPYSFLADIRKDLSPTTLVTGWIGHVRGSLNILGKKIPEVLDYPEELRIYQGRKIWSTTMGEFRKRKSSIPVFIKPSKVQKAFTGHISSGEVKDLIVTAGQPDDLEIYCSEPIEFLSEYRVLVHHGMMIACRHYAGDFTQYPDLELAQYMIKDFKSAPCAYALDLGVTLRGTNLVEVNDFWSLGSYGTDSVIYLQALIDRWIEMVS